MNNKKKKYLLGGVLYGAAKAFGANDTIANSLGAAGGVGEMFFNPLGGGADALKYGTGLASKGKETQLTQGITTAADLAGKFAPLLAYGGNRKQIYANGGYNDYEGPSHENGGIDLNPYTEVEGGESEYKGYIYSNRVKKDGLSYAEHAKKIYSKYKKRLKDDLALESMDREFKELEANQEIDPQIIKGRSTEQNKMSMGGPKKPPTYEDSLALYNLSEQGLDMYKRGISSVEEYLAMKQNHDQAEAISQNTGIQPTAEMPQKYWELNDKFYTGIPKGTQAVGYSQYIYKKPTGKKAFGGIDEGDPLKTAFDNLQPGMFGTDDFGKSTPPVDSFGNPMVTDFKRVSADPSQIWSEMYNQKMSSIPATQLPTKQASLAPSQTMIPKSGAMTQFPDSNIPISGALLNSIGPAAQLAGTLAKGPDVTKFDRVNPSLVDYDPAIGLAQRTAAGTRGNAKAGIVNNARSSGQLLSNLTGANVAINKNLTDTISGISMNERNTNAGIMNQTNTTNAQIQMQEKIANEQNKAAYRQAIYSALGDLGNIGAGYVKDNAMLDAQTTMNNRTLNMLGSLPFRATYDINGNLILK